MGDKTKIAASEPKEHICTLCGAVLTDENCRYEGAPYCFECESKSFIAFEQTNGAHLALFYNCLRFDVPLHPLLLTEEFTGAADKWAAYLQILDENGKLWISDRPAMFEDGETNIFRIFGKNMSEKDFATFCRYEKERLDKLQGTEIQREMWGVRDLWQNLPLTTEIYNELDRRYETKIARYKGITIDAMLSDTLKKICRLEIAQDYLQSIGDASSFDKVQKSIDSILASEQLRKKDEKPVEGLRLDALVNALEEAGFMESGDLLSYDELLVAMRDHFVKSKKYKYSLDVADQVILDVINSMRANADEAALTELTEEYAAVDEYGEFEAAETAQEKENKRYAGLPKVTVVKSGKGKVK